MTDEDMRFWEDVDDKIYDIIHLIRAKYPKFSDTPIQKVITSLLEAYNYSGSVARSVGKGWL